MVTDINLIKETYASMLDSQLEHLAITEGTELTEEALAALKAEFAKRKLDFDVFAKVESGKNDNRATLENETTIIKFDTKIWEFVFEEKRLLKPDSDIIQGLLQKGLHDQEARYILDNVESSCRYLLRKSKESMFYNSVIFFVGIAITVFTYILAAPGGTYVIAWGAIVFGVLRYSKSLENKRKYESILVLVSSNKAEKAATAGPDSPQ